MIIDTQDDRRLEVEPIGSGERLYIGIESPHGAAETIILDFSEMRRLQSFLNEAYGEKEK